MARLLPPLETLSQKHPEVFIQELASNLRTVIATHGACRPEDLNAAAAAAAQRSRNPPEKKKKQPEATSSQTSPPQSKLPPKAFSELLLEACDLDVPTRAVALRFLTKMVQNKHQEAVQAQEKVLMVGCFVCVYYISCVKILTNRFAVPHLRPFLPQSY